MVLIDPYSFSPKFLMREPCTKAPDPCFPAGALLPGPSPCTEAANRHHAPAAPGVASVRAPEGNGCAERFIRTLEENLLWVRSFDTVEELRQALLEFRETYDATWLIERHGFRTPDAVRREQLQPAALAA